MNKTIRNTALIFLVLALCLSIFAGCSGKKDDDSNSSSSKTSSQTEKTTETTTAEQTDKPTTQKYTQPPTTTAPNINTQSTTPAAAAQTDGSDIFTQISNKEFIFCSGVGAWGTVLTVQSDGSFSGEYHDTNMGETGDGYPNGTMYKSDFTGTFGQAKKIDSTTYSIKMLNISYKNTPDTEEIIGGMKYKYSNAYGLTNASEVYVYTPQTPTAGLPKDFVDWTKFLKPYSGSVIGYYGLYNVNGKQGFYEKDG